MYTCIDKSKTDFFTRILEVFNSNPNGLQLPRSTVRCPTASSSIAVSFARSLERSCRYLDNNWEQCRCHFCEMPTLEVGLQVLHPGRLTWNLKMMVWKMSFLFNWVIFGFRINLAGCDCMVGILFPRKPGCFTSNEVKQNGLAEESCNWTDCFQFVSLKSLSKPLIEANQREHRWFNL